MSTNPQQQQHQRTHMRTHRGVTYILAAIVGIGIVLTIIFGLLVPSAHGASADFQVPNPAGFLPFIFDQAFVTSLLTLIVLAIADVVFGVAVAFQEKAFDFSKLADFYGSFILPKFLGWFMLAVVLKAITYFSLNDIASTFSNAVVLGSWGVLLMSLIADILSKMQKVFGSTVTPPPPTKPA